MTALRHIAAPHFAITDAAALASAPEAWDDLAARAHGTHPHFLRPVVEAHRRHGLAPRDLAVLAVRRGEHLDAVLPFTQHLDVVGLGRRVATPFLSPFVTATAPLVADHGDLAGTLAALVAGLGVASGGRAWRWPLLAVASRTGAALLAAMREAGWSIGEVGRFERPVLQRRESEAAFRDGHPHPARLKDLRRRRRRLSEVGTLCLDTATGGPALGQAVETFVTLEAAGWKGAAGTAMRSDRRTEAFAHGLFTEHAGPVATRADTLSLDGRPLAVSLALVHAGTATLLKTTYDEAWRSFAPGLVLEAEIVHALHETRFADLLDSATLAGSALENLFRERETIAEIVAVPPGGGALERRVALARFEHRARADAKRLLGRR